jgi:hypothetical protein
MSPAATERLYNLLPAVYRVRDADQGEPLRALMALLEQELEVVREDIQRLGDNWFIETCDDWVVPYIGDLLGVRGLHGFGRGDFSQRAYVANALAYRRRKGTAPVLEQLARDVTGWPARAVEFFERLSTTQYINHTRLDSLRTPDLRRAGDLELLGGPFERAAHTAEVRRIASGRGRYNIPNLGLFLWRLQSYAVTRGAARAAATPADGRYTFSPLGQDAPLFNRPQTETDITHLADEINVPGPLRRRPLYEELEALRQSQVDGTTWRPGYFGTQPVLQVFVDSQADPIPPAEMMICDLSAWDRPQTSKSYQPQGGGAGQALPIQVSVDPVLGRLAFPTGVVPAQVHVSYAYGFSDDVGGGPYDRRDGLAEITRTPPAWQRRVSKELAPVPGDVVATLTEAIQAWNALPAGSMGVIWVLDSETYQENLTGASGITIPEGSQLRIAAANGRRPHLRGDVSVRGTAPGNSLTPGALIVDGLLVEGALTVLTGNLGRLHLAHSTLVIGLGGLVVNPSVVVGQQNAQLRVVLERCIGGPIGLPETVGSLRAADCILSSGTASAADQPAVTAPGAAVELERCTVFGTTTARSLEASTCLFTGLVQAERRQIGCVRFSALPDGSRTPRRYHCQPDLALDGVNDPAEIAHVLARLTPTFTSVDYGNPGYAQLSRTCAPELRTGAEDGSEMGVFSSLKQPQREANLRASLEEYLRFGLEAGIFFVT